MKTAEERFMDKVSKTDTCWIWTGGKRHFGYGVFSMGGKLYGSHRMSWELFKGAIPKGMWILHKCDNPSCVNPDHLFLGTPKDNMGDMIKKGRNRPKNGWIAMMKVRKIHFGESNPRSKLKGSEVEQILSTPKRFGYMSELARKFNVTHEAIRSVINGKTWTNPRAKELE